MHYTALLSLCAFVSTVWAQQPQIIKPGRGGATYEYGNNPRYREGSTMQFQWTAGIDNIKLVLWQEWPVVQVGTNYYDILMKNGGKLTTYDWVVKVLNTSLLKDGEDAVLYFDIMDANDTDKRRIDTSSYFNVTRATRPKSFSGIASSTFSDVASSTDLPSSATDNSWTSPSPNSGDGLSKGAVAGIAVGATLGGILLLGGVGFLLGKRFARQKESQSKDSGDSVQSEPSPRASPQPQSVQPVSELSNPSAELPVQDRDYSQHQHYNYSQAVPAVVHEAP